MDKRKPSEVFLELWRARELQTPEAFRECAESWMAIVVMEAMHATESRPKSTPKSTRKSTPESAAKSTPESVESTPAEEVQNGPDPVRSKAGAEGLATRKRNVIEKLEAMRKGGVSMQAVADAAKGLNISDVLDAVERKPLSLPVLSKLEKALKNLEATAT